MRSRAGSPKFATVWSEMSPAEEARIVQLLIERVDLREIKALAQAWRWQKLLDAGVYTSVNQTSVGAFESVGAGPALAALGHRGRGRTVTFGACH